MKESARTREAYDDYIDCVVTDRLKYYRTMIQEFIDEREEKYDDIDDAHPHTAEDWADDIEKVKAFTQVLKFFGEE